MLDSIIMWASGLFLIIGLILFFFMFKRCKKPSQVARRKIKSLQRAYSNDQNNNEATAQQLSTLLQSGLGVSELALFKTQETTKWESFLTNLEMACGSNQSSTDDLNTLFEQSYFWLESV